MNGYAYTGYEDIKFARDNAKDGIFLVTEVDSYSVVYLQSD